MRILRKLFLIASPVISVLSFFLLIILTSLDNEKWTNLFSAALFYNICFNIVWTFIMMYGYGSLRHSKWNIPVMASVLLVAFCPIYSNYFPALLSHILVVGDMLGLGVFYTMHFLNKADKSNFSFFKWLFVILTAFLLSSFVFKYQFEDVIYVLWGIGMVVIYILLINQILGFRKKLGADISLKENVVFQEEDMNDDRRESS